MIALPYRQRQVYDKVQTEHGNTHDNSMNFNALRYFLEVANCQSIRRASERLHVAASAISRQISALEHELDCTLLERRSDGVTLTAAGERLLAHGQKIDAQVQLVRSDIDELRNLHRGTIKLATVEGITENFLPDVMTQFALRYPEVRIEVAIMSRDETVDSLDRYESDIGFVYDHAHHDAIEIAADYKQALHAFVPPGHRLAKGESVSLRQLLKHDHLMADSSFGISQLLIRAARKDKTRVAPRMISNQLHFLKKLAQSNNCVVFMPVQAAYTELMNDCLIPVNLECQAFGNRNLSIAYRKRRNLSAAALSFSECASERFLKWQSLDEAALMKGRSAWSPQAS